LGKNGLGYILGIFLTNSSGHPERNTRRVAMLFSLFYAKAANMTKNDFAFLLIYAQNKIILAFSELWRAVLKSDAQKRFDGKGGYILFFFA
jgi:hypothetical protein